MNAHSNKLQQLQSVFGFNEFRANQENVVDKILAGEDVLLILPTGGGKSLCYQLPAILMDGVLVVVSPLLSLMQDQVLALQNKGIAAAMMSSMQSVDENDSTKRDMQNGKIKIIFVAPERLQNGHFLRFLQSIKISFFAIDEAHCVSEWGHEFREDYRELGLLRDTFPTTSIAAFTATATRQVEQDIATQLQYATPYNIIRGAIYRDNLLINVLPRHGNGRAQLLDFLHNHQNEQGIIYAQSRKNTEELSDFLCANGMKSQAYHAGLSTEQRKLAFANFVNDDIDIVVATIAFGMGIDKPNIRFVVHVSLPKTMEAYYQEMGRAGRDGLPCEVLLLHSTADLALQTRFINEIENDAYRELAHQKLSIIKKYAFSENCRHQALSAYFDDQMSPCQIQCDNCKNIDAARTDISEPAKMFLSAIYRSGQRFGQAYIIDILLGSKVARLLENNHQSLSVYGIGKQTNRNTWRIIGDRLVEIGALISNDFGALKITDVGSNILKSTKIIDIRTSNIASQISEAKPKNATTSTPDIHPAEPNSATPDTTPIYHNATPGKTKIPAIIYQVDKQIFQPLKDLRSKFASEAGLPAYCVFDNKTINHIAHFLPQTPEELLKIKGVGPEKLEKYGPQFLALIHQLTPADFTPPTQEIIHPKPAFNKQLDNDPIFAQLSDLMRTIAREEKMPAYIIFDNKVLHEMASFLPTTEEKLLQINGVSQVKLEKYGERFLSLIKQIKPDDFVEPSIEITAPSTKSHPTYQFTLDLINQNFSVPDICSNRDLTIGTIFNHLNHLVSTGAITPATRIKLLQAIPTNPAINDWIKQGIKTAGSLETINYHLAVFKQLHGD